MAKISGVTDVCFTYIHPGLNVFEEKTKQTSKSIIQLTTHTRARAHTHQHVSDWVVIGLSLSIYLLTYLPIYLSLYLRPPY